MHINNPENVWDPWHSEIDKRIGLAMKRLHCNKPQNAIVV